MPRDEEGNDLVADVQIVQALTALLIDPCKHIAEQVALAVVDAGLRLSGLALTDKGVDERVHG